MHSWHLGTVRRGTQASGAEVSMTSMASRRVVPGPSAAQPQQCGQPGLVLGARGCSLADREGAADERPPQSLLGCFGGCTASWTPDPAGIGITVEMGGQTAPGSAREAHCSTWLFTHLPAPGQVEELSTAHCSLDCQFRQTSRFAD